MKFTAIQFDPDQKYPEAAWAHGPGLFFASTPNRGHVPLSKSDWILEFPLGEDNVERLVVSNVLYHAFFEGLLEKEEHPAVDTLVTESEKIREVLSLAEEKSTKEADDSEESGKSGKSDPVAGKDSKSRK